MCLNVQTDTVASAVYMMQRLRVSAVLVENDANQLAGILTERDLVTRVLAQGLAPDATCVAAVMTPQPKCVTTNSKVCAYAQYAQASANLNAMHKH